MPNAASTSRVVLAVALVALMPAIGVVRANEPHGAVRDAIELAVAKQVRATSVRAEVITSSIAPVQTLTATAEPGARSGQASRFLLWSAGTRVGTAVARVEVIATHVVARRAIGRDEVIGADDVAVLEGSIDDLPLRRLPALAEIIGTQARRAIAAGEVMTAAVVTVPPVVRSGDPVTVTVRAGSVEVSGVGRASGSGHVGDEIRVTRPGSRQVRRARITGPGEVEILQ